MFIVMTGESWVTICDCAAAYLPGVEIASLSQDSCALLYEIGKRFVNTSASFAGEPGGRGGEFTDLRLPIGRDLNITYLANHTFENGRRTLGDRCRTLELSVDAGSSSTTQSPPSPSLTWSRVSLSIQSMRRRSRMSGLTHTSTLLPGIVSNPGC